MFNTHRQRTEIVQAGNFDFAGIDGLKNAGHETDSGSVAELGVFEAELPDFAQHGAPISVPMRVPTGRKRKHVNGQMFATRAHLINS